MGMCGEGGGARLHEPLTAVDVVPACYLYIHKVLKNIRQHSSAVYVGTVVGVVI